MVSGSCTLVTTKQEQPRKAKTMTSISTINETYIETCELMYHLEKNGRITLDERAYECKQAASRAARDASDVWYQLKEAGKITQHELERGIEQEAARAARRKAIEDEAARLDAETSATNARRREEAARAMTTSN